VTFFVCILGSFEIMDMGLLAVLV